MKSHYFIEHTSSNMTRNHMVYNSNNVRRYFETLNDIIMRFNQYESFGLGRFATDHSLTKAASRPLFARVQRNTPQRDN